MVEVGVGGQCSVPAPSNDVYPMMRGSQYEAIDCFVSDDGDGKQLVSKRIYFWHTFEKTMLAI